MNRFLLACVLFASIGSASAQGSSGATPDIVRRETLPNGMRIVVVPDRLAPVVSTELTYLVGSNDAPEGFPGTAHALEHMMFRGSAGLDRDQLSELGALLGGIYNASTTENVTRYTYTVPAADLGLALRSEAARMQSLNITQKDWEQERGAIEQEVARDLSSPMFVYSEEARAVLFKGSPLEHDALGTRDSFDKTDAALLRTFYEKWYAPNNAVLVIAGNVDAAAALAEARAVFSPIPSRPVPPHAPVTLGPVMPTTLQLPTDLSVGLVAITTRMPALPSKDFAAADILADVLGSDRGALFALVPAGRALSARFEYDAMAESGFGTALAAFPRGGDAAPVLADLQRVLGAAAAGHIPPELVEAARQQELAQLAFSSDSISGLASAWSRAITMRGDQSPDDLAKAYAAVTQDDVIRVAREVLNPDHMVTAILTPSGAARPTSDARFGGAESFGAAPDHPVVLPDWAASALAALHAPEPSPPPVQSVLPNGLRLIVQPEHVSRTVTLVGRIRHVTATQEPEGQEGVAGLTEKMFEEGTETRDRLALRKAFDDIAAVESAGSGFELKVLSPAFEQGVQLLAEHELHPDFPPTAFVVARSQAVQSLQGQRQTPGYLTGRAVVKALVPEGDPNLREPSPETLQALTLADIQAYYRAAFRPDLTTIVVVGDVTPEAARQVIEAAFGTWSRTGPTPALDLPRLPPNPPSMLRVPNPSRQQDRVILAESIGLNVASPARYSLELGNMILGGGFSSRLYQELRVKTGYVYSVSSGFDWQRTRALYNVQFGADPGNLMKARDLVQRELAKMQTDPVTETELRRVKAQVLRRLGMQDQSVGGIAANYLRLIDLNLPLNQSKVAAQRYLAITADDIQQAYTEWLRPAGLAQVVEGPPLP